MHEDRRDLLDVLKSELAFLKEGKYRSPDLRAWRPKFIFQDSPSCLNHELRDNHVPCSSCVLISLVPAEHRRERIPCRHIPLNEDGETVDYLYRTGNQDELENALAGWLRKTIEEMEQQNIRRKALGPAANPTFFHRND